MNKIPTTKWIMSFLIGINICVMIFLCVMMWKTGDLSPAPYIAIGEGGPLSVWLASYAFKEKSANRNKYAMRYVDKIAEKYDVETALRMAEIVLQD